MRSPLSAITSVDHANGPLAQLGEYRRWKRLFDVDTGSVLQKNRASIIPGQLKKQIADEPVVAWAPPNATRHIANVFGKLGVQSRSQVAAWLAQRPADSADQSC